MSKKHPRQGAKKIDLSETGFAGSQKTDGSDAKKKIRPTEDFQKSQDASVLRYRELKRDTKYLRGNEISTSKKAGLGGGLELQKEAQAIQEAMSVGWENRKPTLGAANSILSQQSVAKPKREQHSDTSVTIPHRLTGILIGPRGYKVRRLTHATRSNISVNRDEKPNCTVTVSAESASDLSVAVAALRELVAEIVEVDQEQKEIADFKKQEAAIAVAAVVEKKKAEEAKEAKRVVTLTESELPQGAKEALHTGTFSEFFAELQREKVRANYAVASALFKQVRHGKKNMNQEENEENQENEDN